MTTCLTDLPVELLEMILRLITTQRDLSALCLVCRLLRELAVPLRKYKIILEQSEISSFPTRTLNEDNLIIKHTVTVIIRDDDMQGLDTNAQVACLRSLLELFPTDKLRMFDLDTLSPVPLQLIRMLYERQGRLYHVFLPHYSPPSSLVLSKLRSNGCRITSVSLYISCVADARNAREVLRRRAIHLQGVSLTFTDGTTASTRQQTPRKESWLLFEVFFSPDGRRTKPVRLKKLFISNMILSGVHFQPRASLKHCIDFGCLETLSLRNCARIEKIMQSNPTPKLRNYAEDRCWATWYSGHYNLCALLQSSREMNELLITRRGAGYRGQLPYYPNETEGTDGFLWNSIRNQAATLRILFLDDLHNPFRRYFEVCRDFPAFRTLCEQCVQLKQLAIQAPKSFDEFEISYKDEDEGAFFAEALQALPKLVSLRLIIYPDMPACVAQGHASQDNSSELETSGPTTAALVQLGASPDESTTTFFCGMQRLANELFTRLHQSCPELTALQMDARQVGNVNGPDLQFGFVRERQPALDGPGISIARPVPAHTLRYYTSASRIFRDRYSAAWV